MIFLPESLGEYRICASLCRDSDFGPILGRQAVVGLDLGEAQSHITSWHDLPRCRDALVFFYALSILIMYNVTRQNHS